MIALLFDNTYICSINRGKSGSALIDKLKITDECYIHDATTHLIFHEGKVELPNMIFAGAGSGHDLGDLYSERNRDCVAAVIAAAVGNLSLYEQPDKTLLHMYIVAYVLKMNIMYDIRMHLIDRFAKESPTALLSSFVADIAGSIRCGNYILCRRLCTELAQLMNNPAIWARLVFSRKSVGCIYDAVVYAEALPELSHDIYCRTEYSPDWQQLIKNEYAYIMRNKADMIEPTYQSDWLDDTRPIKKRRMQVTE